jgi:hypothetical protein
LIQAGRRAFFGRRGGRIVKPDVAGRGFSGLKFPKKDHAFSGWMGAWALFPKNRRILPGLQHHRFPGWLGMRRFTRLTNAFSKKVENHEHMVALYFTHYNFCRIHQTLRVTPAMEAGISKHVWGLEEIVNLIEQ